MIKQMTYLKKILFYIQTTFQRDMLMKFGNELICMDGTHGLTCMIFIWSLS